MNTALCGSPSGSRGPSPSTGSPGLPKRVRFSERHTVLCGGRSLLLPQCVWRVFVRLHGRVCGICLTRVRVLKQSVSRCGTGIFLVLVLETHCVDYRTCGGCFPISKFAGVKRVAKLLGSKRSKKQIRSWCSTRRVFQVVIGSSPRFKFNSWIDCPPGCPGNTLCAMPVMCWSGVKCFAKWGEQGS